MKDINYYKKYLKYKKKYLKYKNQIGGYITEDEFINAYNKGNLTDRARRKISFMMAIFNRNVQNLESLIEAKEALKKND